MQQHKQNNINVQSNREKTQFTSGYKFTLQNKTYSQYLSCKICSKFMIDPVRLYPCGHTFCKSCILEQNIKNSANNQSARQNKCFISFPQCGKYYITLQPDLMAASLIDDLEVHCLSEGCPWTGPLERFRISHKEQCKLKSGGLKQWLNEINKGAQKIRRQRKQRISNTCIDIDEDSDKETFQKENNNKNNFNSLQNLFSGNKKAVQKLILASNGPSSDFRGKTSIDDLEIHKEDDVLEVSEVNLDKEQNSIKQIKPLLGLDKNLVGDKITSIKHQKSTFSDKLSDSKIANKRDSQLLKKRAKQGAAIELQSDEDNKEKTNNNKSNETYQQASRQNDKIHHMNKARSLSQKYGHQSREDA